jgi:hypothetical protein
VTQRSILTFTMTAALGLLVASQAMALHNQPDKGKNFKVNLMTAYEPCTSPDTVTDDAVPACSTLQRSDPTCGFVGGQGKVQLKSLTVGNQAYRIKMNGLDVACSGQTLNFFISYRKTGHLCNGGITSCTTQDVLAHALGGCVVDDRGKCKLSGAQFLPGGANIGQIEILEVYVERTGLRSFNTGLIIQKP